ncbi:MAG TPA: type II toxin-antitoxin system PemK/MazF family toxin [Candidatus Binatia bacterium]|nr:type II toxin-antitoxin system PemK/MazF family toxin [Candidatus Binatia bacterium]
MVERGQLWWAELPNPTKSEPGYKRPVLIVQANSFNVSKLSTVVVVAITSNLRLADVPGNVRLLKGSSGLNKESVANISQITTLDKEDLIDIIGNLDGAVMRQVDNGLQLVLSV